jgi:hypothetical protein
MDGANPMILDIGLAVRVITSIRTHTAMREGCPEWDAHGVRAMLTGSEGTPGAVLAAACLAAEDASLRKPSPAALRNHWPVNAATTAPVTRQALECPEHRQQFPCEQCKAAAGPELTPEQIADRAAECRRIASERIAQAERERRDLETRQETQP